MPTILCRTLSPIIIQPIILSFKHYPSPTGCGGDSGISVPPIVALIKHLFCMAYCFATLYASTGLVLTN